MLPGISPSLNKAPQRRIGAGSTSDPPDAGGLLALAALLLLPRLLERFQILGRGTHGGEPDR